ncbi:hypothetical protein [Levilactobacillus andaensis]|uniref:hypothetical protein n=1 Tax=Levilactobacillus andaensis TaxID=2799570 RepID=UPI0019419BFB|nr:hypothetical protein [Levilactobacillus andaensis]
MIREQKIEIVAGMSGLSVATVKLIAETDSDQLEKMIVDLGQRFGFQAANAASSWF